MHTPPNSACAGESASASLPQAYSAEIVYRGLTLAAMLLLLASLWVF